MSFGRGNSGFPAITMTAHAANKYAEWLSARTGEFYRVPTEAEWEYACRAGGPPSLDEAQLAEAAWYQKNSPTTEFTDGTYHKLGTKKPNAWGLHDMLGNVMEWTADQYAPYPAAPATNPSLPPTRRIQSRCAAARGTTRPAASTAPFATSRMPCGRSATRSCRPACGT